jgi:hypothetical protein
VGLGGVGWGGGELDETATAQLAPLHVAMVRDRTLFRLQAGFVGL